MPEARIEEAVSLMKDFAERTGLTSDQPPRRYLWTDAFAVCNYLGLARTTGEPEYTELALRLVDQVHHTLGKHRDDDARRGWISGVTDAEGERHPTRGGLRIGKALPERRTDEPFDERLEWERDGQYFHYLTKWMYALNQVARATGDSRFNLWARELALTAHSAFTYVPSSTHIPRMYWKMSIDLSYPLVPSMGQHDPLDGYLTTLQLRATAASLEGSLEQPTLEGETKHFSAMIQGGDWATPDPLGLGGLLIDAYRTQQLIQQGAAVEAQLLEALLEDSRIGLRYYVRRGELDRPAEFRLAFRELGLAIGIRALQRMKSTSSGLGELMRYTPLADEIESFWLNPEHQRAATWLAHRDINEVMLATSLAPGGFLQLILPDEI